MSTSFMLGLLINLAVALALPSEACAQGSPAVSMGDMKEMGDMKMGPMQGGKPAHDARDADAHAEGAEKAPMPGMEMADDVRFARVMLNELEYTNGSGKRGQSLDAEAWYGGDVHKFWVKAEGRRSNGKLEELRTEALWSRQFATYWASQAGVRHDTGRGPSRTWFALGVQGLAPYWFETEAALYLGRSGALAARGEVRYDQALTQQLRLEPNLYSKDDPARGIGAGLSDLQFGLRLRYEVRRQFAPYIGVTWDRKFGGTADFARAAGEPITVRQVVVGVRAWF
jgi:copper resistance protein B